MPRRCVEFDSDIVAREVILDVFFTLHDPTQLNRQGADVGTQYRSDFFAKNPGQGYCLAVALPKVDKIRRSYADHVLV